MAPTVARPPFHRNGWIYEERVDGWRIIRTRTARTSASWVRDAVDHNRLLRW